VRSGVNALSAPPAGRGGEASVGGLRRNGTFSFRIRLSVPRPPGVHCCGASFDKHTSASWVRETTVRQRGWPDL
jgi:hypothetical protein